MSLKSFRDGRGGGLQLLDKLVLVFKMGPQTATLAKEMHDRLTLGPVKILLPQGSRMVELKTAATQVLDARYFLDQSGKDTGGLYAEVTLSASAYGMFVDGVDVGG
ncbi:MAG: hypothetical protein HYR64_06825 [Fimbriimonas ginsengisoli]|uniref:Uncharacterized protein n=1 Tax=Fimbriimonas ginsengisoli TaxID=1005039 RepID=A0A931LSU4_FIMGI|nr:hypothetical protein [Fimbriimonas ginsengisoli]